MINVLVGGLSRTLAASLEARLEGAAVHVADTGAEALEWLAGRSCQLLVLDQSLPGIAAIDVVRALTENFDSAALPVLYCLRRDASAREERDRAERLGIQTFLMHPFDAEQLAARVREAVDALPTNGKRAAQGVPSGEGAAADVALNLGWDRIGRSLTRRLDTLDRAAIAVLEGTFTDQLKAQAWHEARQIAEILTAFGRRDAAGLARDIQTLVERRGELGSGETLRVSELAVALRNEIERPVAFAAEAFAQGRPLLLLIDRPSEFAESVMLEAEASGLRCEHVTDPESARALIGKDAPAVVFVDLDAADQPDTWIAFIAEISDRCPDAPVLVAISAASLSSRVAVARAGGFSLVRKPISPASAVAAAGEAIRRTDLKNRRIMAVDDDNAALWALRCQLETASVELTTLDDPRRFWETLEAVRPEVVLLDMHMPHYSGLELCRVLRADERWARITVVILGDRMDAASSHLAHVAGADDFLAKPVVSSDLITRIANRLERLRIAEERAGMDPLTGLPTPKGSEASLELLVRLATIYRRPLALAVLNVDGLPTINESVGHAVGDAVLRRLGRLLRGGFRAVDLVGRWGGNQFVVGAHGMEKDDCVRRLSDLLAEFRNETFRAGETEVQVHFSAGVSALSTDGADLPALLKAAGETLAQATSLGRGRILPSGWRPDRSRPTEWTDVTIVDRDGALAGLLQHTFEQNGWRSTWFEEADDATAALCGPYPLIRAAVVLLEVELPGRDGFSVLRALARDDVLARTRVIMMTARAGESEVLKAFELGAVDHVAKPFSVQVLLQRIRRAMRS